jgi:hypothetical protein
VALIWVAIRVDHRNLDAVDETDRIDAHLAIVVAIVGPFDRRSVENARRVLKGDPVRPDIAGVLRRIPGEPDRESLRNVFTHVEM